MRAASASDLFRGGQAFRPSSDLLCPAGRCMYLLYADESGSQNSEHFTLGGLAVHEQDAYPLARDVDAIFKQLPGSLHREELHAQQIRVASGVWASLPKANRDQLVRDISELLVGGVPTPRRSPVLFAVTFHKASFPNQDPQERTYEEFFARCNGMLGRLASQGDNHRCVVVADKVSRKLEASLQPMMLNWRESGASTGAAIGPLSAYAEVPLFVDSKASRLVQLADFVAHWVYRAYESSDDSVLRKLISGFDQEDGRRHGLVHLVHRYRTCDCLACSSRPRRLA